MSHGKTLASEQSLLLLDKVRTICTQYPEVTESTDLFGHISFRVNDKPFVMMGEKDDIPTMSIKTAPSTQEFLLQQEDGNYSKTRYIGQHGWVSLRSVTDINWEEVKDLIEEGYGRTAPKRLLRALHHHEP
ncbi:MmcQ/YjbR family DNA-binding protein [Paenibacillus sp. NPDC056579]|uniref:MmcQ/YjbR family DNA-binding protein n=1 Tax=Paenibacillus sp. NPDC056579 TaxID=3345871 RepID=UPI00368E81D9